MLKISLPFILLTLLFSCSTPHPGPKLGFRDTVVVTFKPKKGLRGPVQVYVGAYEVVRKITMDTSSLKGSYEIGYKWSVKISDTTPDGKGHQILDTLHHPIALWSPVPDSLSKFLTIDTTDSDGGQSLDHHHANQRQRVFILKGLNKPWKANGFPHIYATIEYGKEDWFHCGFDEKLFADDRLSALFDLFKNTEDNLWSGKTHKVLIEFEKLSSSGCPVKPLIKKLYLDDL